MSEQNGTTNKKYNWKKTIIFLLCLGAFVFAEIKVMDYFMRPCQRNPAIKEWFSVMLDSKLDSPTEKKARERLISLGYYSCRAEIEEAKQVEVEQRARELEAQGK